MKKFLMIGLLVGMGSLIFASDPIYHWGDGDDGSNTTLADQEKQLNNQYGFGDPEKGDKSLYYGQQPVAEDYKQTATVPVVISDGNEGVALNTGETGDDVSLEKKETDKKAIEKMYELAKMKQNGTYVLNVETVEGIIEGIKEYKNSKDQDVANLANETIKKLQDIVTEIEKTQPQSITQPTAINVKDWQTNKGFWDMPWKQKVSFIKDKVFGIKPTAFDNAIYNNVMDTTIAFKQDVEESTSYDIKNLLSTQITQATEALKEALKMSNISQQDKENGFYVLIATVKEYARAVDKKYLSGKNKIISVRSVLDNQMRDFNSSIAKLANENNLGHIKLGYTN